MAEALLDSFLTCSICLDTFTEPVTLGCNHSFCSSCLQQHWSQQPRTCPVCRRRASKEHPGVNFALKELSEQFRQKLQVSASTQQTPQPVGTEAGTEGKAWSVCPSHPQVPAVFCLDGCGPLCPLCEFSKHPQHTVVREQEAERRLKELISSQLQALTEEKLRCEELQQSFEQIQRHSEEQAGHCERHIRAVFSELHRFLQEEEQRNLSALRQEQLRQKQAMDPELQKVKEKLNSVDKNIQELQRQLQTHSYRPQPQPQDQPQLSHREGLLLDQAKVLGNLGFRVWRNMRSMKEVQFRPVLLDPNTAKTVLTLSEDLSSVRRGDTLNKDLPLNPERFSKYASVLGSEGFSSGIHQWEVEVGDHPQWAIGVVKESVERKEKTKPVPDNGYWCLRFNKGKHFDVFHKPLILERRPEKIRVRLDFDRGQLTFTDADHMTPICSYTGSFTEKMIPYFNLGPADGAKTTELRVCGDLSVTP